MALYISISNEYNVKLIYLVNELDNRTLNLCQNFCQKIDKENKSWK